MIKFKKLFILICLLLKYSLTINLSASEIDRQLTSCNNPFVIIYDDLLSNITYNLDITSLRNWKLVCKHFNNKSNYTDISLNIIETEDYNLCSNGLIYFAHTSQNENFIHFLQNYPKPRKKTLKLLGWTKNISTEDQINAYQGIPAPKKPKDLSFALENLLAIKIICQSTNPNIQDNNNRTLLSFACMNNCPDIIKQLLLNKNTNPNTPDKDRQTALHKAARDGFTEIVMLLTTDKRTKLNIEDNHGNTPLDSAYIGNNAATINLLSEKNAQHGSQYHKLWWNALYKPLFITIILLVISIKNFYNTIYSTSHN